MQNPWWANPFYRSFPAENFRVPWRTVLQEKGWQSHFYEYQGLSTQAPSRKFLPESEGFECCTFISQAPKEENAPCFTSATQSPVCYHVSLTGKHLFYPTRRTKLTQQRARCISKYPLKHFLLVVSLRAKFWIVGKPGITKKVIAQGPKYKCPDVTLLFLHIPIQAIWEFGES